MSTSNDYEFPEWGRIGSMMRDLMDQPAAPTARRAAPSARAAKPRKTARHHKVRGKRLGAFSVADFSTGVNWANAQGYRSPLSVTNTPQTRSRLGAVSVAAFAEATNWRNAQDGPQLIAALTDAKADPNAGPPPSVEDFFETMIWE
jgi:hypothetical protein